MFKIGAFFFILYFAANYTMNLAFGMTSVGSASILASTSGLFTLIFGFLLKQEKVTTLKVFAILVSVGGAAIISNEEFSSKDNKAAGNICALVSALLYGVYSVSLKKVSVDESRLNAPLLFGIIGFFSSVALWPIFLIFHYTKFETFSWPNGEILGFLLLNIFFGSFLANFLWIVAMSYSTPLVVALGLSMNIPLTLAGEIVIQHNSTIPSYKIWSALCVVIGFLIVNVAELFPRIDKYLDGKFCCAKRKTQNENLYPQ